MALNFVKSALRPTLGYIFGYAGRPFLKNALTVFLYHDVSETPGEFSRVYDLNVDPRVFRFQMEFIQEHFNVISPDDFLQSHLPARAALVTFDDGLRGYFQNAVPILAELQIPSLIFLNMEPIQGEIFWSGLITYLCYKKADFVTFLKQKIRVIDDSQPLYLYCSKALVEEYLGQQTAALQAEAAVFTGEFAQEQDLRKTAGNPLVFFGNHLFNHEVPIFMPKEALVGSFLKNTRALKEYPGYRNWFSFPFGQPGSCFTREQIAILRQQGAQKIFSAYPLVNFDARSHYLHRIALNSSHDSFSKIWFQIWSRTVRDKFVQPTESL